LGYILGEFNSFSSGHPAAVRRTPRQRQTTLKEKLERLVSDPTSDCLSAEDDSTDDESGPGIFKASMAAVASVAADSVPSASRSQVP
jgi:hypothetical protein